METYVFFHESAVNCHGRRRYYDEFGGKFLDDSEVNNFRTAVPFWGQSTQIPSIWFPKRACSTQGVNGVSAGGTTVIVVVQTGLARASVRRAYEIRAEEIDNVATWRWAEMKKTK